MDVSVIIVNYKTVPLVLNCLESLQNKTEGINYEVIVVDNNSEDNFQTRIQERFPEVQCLSLSENIGFGRANNEGLKIAKGRNVLFLNPDTLLLNNAIKILSDYLDAHPQVGACGGNLYDAEMEPAHSYRMFLPSLFWEMNIWLHNLLEKMLWRKNAQFNHTCNPLKVGFITGADLMIPYQVLRQTGPFSSEFFMYFEDPELCCRISKKGFDIVSVPAARIVHLEGKSFKVDEINTRRLLTFETSYSLYLRLQVSSHQRWLIQLLRMCRLYLKRLLKGEKALPNDLFQKRKSIIRM